MKQRILVVDDRIDNVVAAFAGLPREETDAEAVFDLETAMKFLDEYNPHIALIDLNFPRKAGEYTQELGYELGKELEKRNIPYAIVTAGRENHGHTQPTAEIIHSRLQPDTEACRGVEKTAVVWRQAYEGVLKRYPLLE